MAPIDAPTVSGSTGASGPSETDRREARRWNIVAAIVLPVVAAVGAVLSWGSLYTAATHALGRHAPTPGGVNLAGAAFPLLVDALILGASARYVAGVKAGRPVAGWRLAAHAGVVGTVLLNADAAPSLGEIPWHVTAPIVWSVLVELVARDVLGQLHAVQDRRADRIPLRLWLTTPAESVRVSWRMARTSATDADATRAVTERCAAARDDLAAFLPGRRHARIRRQITRRLWAGALDPATLAHLIDTTDPDQPATLHRTVLRAVATAGCQPAAATESVGERPGESVGERPGERPGESVGESVGERPGESVGERPGESVGERPDRSRPGSRRPVTRSRADAVVRMRHRHPDMPVREIARRLRLHEQTVRRHLRTAGLPVTGQPEAALLVAPVELHQGDQQSEREVREQAPVSAFAEAIDLLTPSDSVRGLGSVNGSTGGT